MNIRYIMNKLYVLVDQLTNNRLTDNQCMYVLANGELVGIKEYNYLGSKG